MYWKNLFHARVISFLLVLLFFFGCIYPGKRYVVVEIWDMEHIQHGKLTDVPFIPRQKYSDRKGLGVTVRSVNARVSESGGVDGVRLSCVVGYPSDIDVFNSSGSSNYQKYIFIDIEARVPGFGPVRKVDKAVAHGIRYGQILDTKYEWYTDKDPTEVDLFYSFGNFRLPPGKHTLEIAVKLYTYYPRKHEGSHSSMVNEYWISEIDRIPFSVLNKTVTVEVPPLDYYRIRIDELGLSTHEKHDAYVPFLGSGKADLIYFLYQNDYPVYVSREYTNSDWMNESTGWLYLGVNDGDSLSVEVGDDDDGIFGIGDKVDWLGFRTIPYAEWTKETRTIVARDTDIYFMMPVEKLNAITP